MTMLATFVSELQRHAQRTARRHAAVLHNRALNSSSMNGKSDARGSHFDGVLRPEFRSELHQRPAVDEPNAPVLVHHRRELVPEAAPAHASVTTHVEVVECRAETVVPSVLALPAQMWTSSVDERRPHPGFRMPRLTLNRRR